jgi:hypothetical protein
MYLALILYLMKMENNLQNIPFKNYRDQSLVTVVIVTTMSHGGRADL